MWSMHLLGADARFSQWALQAEALSAFACFCRRLRQEIHVTLHLKARDS